MIYSSIGGEALKKPKNDIKRLTVMNDYRELSVSLRFYFLGHPIAYKNVCVFTSFNSKFVNDPIMLPYILLLFLCLFFSQYLHLNELFSTLFAVYFRGRHSGSWI